MLKERLVKHCNTPEYMYFAILRMKTAVVRESAVNLSCSGLSRLCFSKICTIGIVHFGQLCISSYYGRSAVQVSSENVSEKFPRIFFCNGINKQLSNSLAPKVPSIATTGSFGAAYVLLYPAFNVLPPSCVYLYCVRQIYKKKPLARKKWTAVGSPCGREVHTETINNTVRPLRVFFVFLLFFFCFFYHLFGVGNPSRSSLASSPTVSLHNQITT